MDHEENTIHLLTDQPEEPHSINTGTGREEEEKTIYRLMAVYVLLSIGLFLLPRIAARLPRIAAGGMDGLAAAGTAGVTAILVGAVMTLTSLVGLGLTMRWWTKLSPRVRAIGILPMVITTVTRAQHSAAIRAVMLIYVAILVKNAPTDSGDYGESTKYPYNSG
jgi:hypothetical protein